MSVRACVTPRARLVWNDAHVTLPIASSEQHLSSLSSDPDSSTAFGVGDATFEWRVFAMLWAFLVLNAALYVSMSHK